MQKQIEITKPVKLLNDDGTLAVKGYAKRNLFIYDRNLCKPKWRRKEWDFYQVSDGNFMVHIAFFNISVASSATATLVDLKSGKRVAKVEVFKPFTFKSYPMPQRGDVPNRLKYDIKGVFVDFNTEETKRTISFKGTFEDKPFLLDFTMDIMENMENITIVTPFDNMPTRFFMTTKQNCMPCQGVVTLGEQKFTFKKENTFAVLDWGRGVWPHKNEWYWGNGATYVDGKIFGFEITWKIGNEENATETCLFYDGKAHKIGAVDVKRFPGDGDRWMEPWEFTSEDGRFEFVMKPIYDHASGDLLLGHLGMKTHQVHGLWSGFAILDDGTKLEIKDMYAFCEYVQNAW